MKSSQHEQVRRWHEQKIGELMNLDGFHFLSDYIAAIKHMAYHLASWVKLEVTGSLYLFHFSWKKVDEHEKIRVCRTWFPTCTQSQRARTLLLVVHSNICNPIKRQIYLSQLPWIYNLSRTNEIHFYQLSNPKGLVCEGEIIVFAGSRAHCLKGGLRHFLFHGHGGGWPVSSDLSKDEVRKTQLQREGEGTCEYPHPTIRK